MTDINFVVIEGAAFSDVKKALEQWIDLYSDSLDKDSSLLLFKNGTGKYLIQADNRIDNEKFCFLVNYLKYPENIHYNAKILGYLTVVDLGIFPEVEPGRKIQLFIPDFDKEYDNVYAVTSNNETYKYDFSGKTIKTELVYKFQGTKIDLSNLGRPDIIKLTVKTDKPNLKIISKRFNILSFIIIILFGISYLFRGTNFILFNFMLGFGISFWLFYEHKMLQINEFYLKSVFIALLIAIYGYYISRDYESRHRNMIIFSSILPLLLLINQKILRFVFKTLMKREPVVAKPAHSFADGVYMFILFLTTFLLPILFINE